ncbi:MAG: isoprenyl transferase [Flavobacteriales bacterium]|nr:isoprenyl transferase [Flavobacteriales bacterium]
MMNKENIPKHIAVIMDGNGRWAKQRGKSRVFGHKNGVVAVNDFVECSAEIGVKYLTLYAFSSENWNRPDYEVNALMQLLVVTIKKEIDKLNKNNIRLQVIGDVESLPSKTRKILLEAIKSTENNDRMTLILALSYSSKWEIMEAVKSIAKKVENNEISSDQVTEELFEQHLNTSDYPDPELLIRTSGENRISNFLLWQIAYSELYFTDKLWPDMRKADLIDAIEDYQSRERRFGKTSEQIESA